MLAPELRPLVACVASRGEQRKDMSKIVAPGSKYTDEDRRQVVVEYCALGNLEQVARNIGIPARTIQGWAKNADWWDTLVTEVRGQINEQILTKNLKIASKAGERVLDSLEHGDEKIVWDKVKGEHVTKRVMPSGKDSMVMSGIAQDKARVQMNLPTSITANTDAQTQIKALAQQFAKLSRHYNAKDITNKVKIKTEQ